ncbi:major facilitator superfamily domain-containing protein [Amanita rubescens]|nr:major facilitator superfamily domain-containing protein [Amanita rubescens]
MEETAVNVYPCGAKKAWSTLCGSFLILVCATGVLQAFGVFQDYYTTVFLTKYTASDISWIGSVQVFFELVLGIVAGKLYDAGYCRSMITGASILFSFSYFMLSLVQKEQYYQTFLAQGIGLGIAIGFLFVPACTLASIHFKYNQALAVGIVLAGGPLGAVVYTIMLNYMLNSSIGFAWSIRAAAFLSAALLLVGNLMITVPPSPSVTASERKSSLKSMRDWPYLLTVMSGFIMLLEMYFPIYLCNYLPRSTVSPKSLHSTAYPSLISWAFFLASRPTPTRSISA